MLLQSIRGCRACLLAVVLLSPPEGLAAERAPEHSSGAVMLAQASSGAMIEYRRQLAAYTAARERYEAEADAYWSAVAEKRRQRVAKRRGKQDVLLQDYVLTQPPVYTGPPPPVDP